MQKIIRDNAPVLFAYLFGRINKFAMRRELGRENAKHIWSLVSNDGYLLMNCKLFAYAHHYNVKHKLPAPSPAKFDIDRADVRALRNLDLSHTKFKYPAMDLHTYTELESRVTASRELATYIGKFISRKLIFLRSYGLTREEMHSLLIYSSIFALRLKYPRFESELHAMNVCKTTIHNTGMSLIEYWTREKRQALIKEGDTFQAVHVSIDNVHDLATHPEHEDENRLNLQVLTHIKGTLSPKENRLLRLASGEHDAGFSMFLGQDNSQVADDWAFPRYLAQVCGYLKISPDEGQRVLTGLRSRFN